MTRMVDVEELCEGAARRVIEAEDLGLPEEWEVGIAIILLEKHQPDSENSWTMTIAAKVGGMQSVVAECAC